MTEVEKFIDKHFVFSIMSCLRNFNFFYLKALNAFIDSIQNVVKTVDKVSLVKSVEHCRKEKGI